jgi:hypothetical protein
VSKRVTVLPPPHPIPSGRLATSRKINSFFIFAPLSVMSALTHNYSFGKAIELLWRFQLLFCFVGAPMM